MDYPWEYEKEYTFKVQVKGPEIKVMSGGQVLIAFTDTDFPYLIGQVGMSILKGSHCHYKDLVIGRI